MSENDIVETASVWEAVSDTAGEAYNRRLRADLVTAIRGQIDRFGLSPPRISMSPSRVCRIYIAES